MLRLEEARLIIRSGEHGTDNDICVHINGHRLVARKLAGGCDPGETMLASLYLGSVVHSLTLSHDGPGEWEVVWVELFAIMSDKSVRLVKLRPEQTLADGRVLNLWPEAPPPAAPPPVADGFDV